MDHVNKLYNSGRHEGGKVKERHAKDKENCPICIRKRLARARKKQESLKEAENSGKKQKSRANSNEIQEERQIPKRNS
jgi:phage terminase Nu1 subunit (DNA packaging protein)